jgi:hypothetical protein
MKSLLFCESNKKKFEPYIKEIDKQLGQHRVQFVEVDYSKCNAPMDLLYFIKIRRDDRLYFLETAGFESVFYFEVLYPTSYYLTTRYVPLKEKDILDFLSLIRLNLARDRLSGQVDIKDFKYIDLKDSNIIKRIEEEFGYKFNYIAQPHRLDYHLRGYVNSGMRYKIVSLIDDIFIDKQQKETTHYITDYVVIKFLHCDSAYFIKRLMKRAHENNFIITGEIDFNAGAWISLKISLDVYQGDK